MEPTEFEEADYCHVAFKMPINGRDPPEPYPAEFSDCWDSVNHIKMPNSCRNEITFVKQNRQVPIKVTVKKWDMIREKLRDEPLRNCRDLITAIKAYNPLMIDDDFKVLETVVEDCLEDEERDKFFKNVLPGMVNLALKLPSLVTKSLPILKQNTNSVIFLSQQQVGSLLANAFFCTFPKRSLPQYRKLPDVNFRSLFSKASAGVLRRKCEKLKCLLNYFRRITEQTPIGVVSFHRRDLKEVNIPSWSSSKKSFKGLKTNDTGLIENEGAGMLQVDFANKLIGGGVLNSGCVQEEIRFVICPELIISRLFTEKLLANEVLFMTGAERFSSYSGYADTFKWSGDYIDFTSTDNIQRKKTRIVAMDATYFTCDDKQSQYHPKCIERELNKAYCAFYDVSEIKTPIATGHWGCGAFNGDPKLKAVLQLLAAAQTNRDLVYFTFGDSKFKSELEKFYDLLQLNDFDVSTLYKHLLDYSEIYSKNESLDFFTFLYHHRL